MSRKYWAVRNIWVNNSRGRELYASKWDLLSHIGYFNDKEVVVANKKGIRLILAKSDLFVVKRMEGQDEVFAKC